MNNAITTESIAELVRSHGTIPAPDVGKHFGQPHWTREIESAAKPLIESGQITISVEHGVVWNHDFQGDLYIAVPHELKARRQWVMWRSVATSPPARVLHIHDRSPRLSKRDGRKPQPTRSECPEMKPSTPARMEQLLIASNRLSDAISQFHAAVESEIDIEELEDQLN